MVLCMLFYAAGANNEATLSEAMLHARRLEAQQALAYVRQELCSARRFLRGLQRQNSVGSVVDDAQSKVDSAEARCEHWASTVDALGDAATAVAYDDKIDPVRILGIRASWTLVQTIAVGGVSAFGAALQILRSRLFPGV
jgi:hypothetical protein